MNNPWTREETIIAFNVFCKIPFKNSSQTHPLIIEYARLIGRTPSALNMKVGNLGRLDPSLRAQGISGLTHGAKMEEEVWNEFAHDPERLAYESERLIAQFAHQNIEQTAHIDTDNLPEGRERERVVRQRVNQSFFRAAVMSAYNFKCCISGVANADVVEAAHIVDWADSVAQRTNPQNGLCLNAFFHKAYDRNLVGITPDGDICVSDALLDSAKEPDFRAYLQTLRGRRILNPEKFLPNPDFLAAHYEHYQRRWN